MTFAQLKTAVKAMVFPKGEPENLVTIHNTYILDALVTIQRFVKCFRSRNYTQVIQDNTYYKCGLTVVNEPSGLRFVRRVSTIDATNACLPIWYTNSSKSHLEFLADKQNAEFGVPTNPDQTGSPVITDTEPGLLNAGPESDADVGRALIGYWAWDKNKIYVYPFIQSTEKLVIEWDGIKDSYSDAEDIYDSSSLLQRAVRLYLQKEVARDITGDIEAQAKAESDFSEALATLVWECRKKKNYDQGGELENPVQITLRPT